MIRRRTPADVDTTGLPRGWDDPRSPYFVPADVVPHYVAVLDDPAAVRDVRRTASEPGPLDVVDADGDVVTITSSDFRAREHAIALAYAHARRRRHDEMETAAAERAAREEAAARCNLCGGSGVAVPSAPFVVTAGGALPDTGDVAGRAAMLHPVCASALTAAAAARVPDDLLDRAAAYLDTLDA